MSKAEIVQSIEEYILDNEGEVTKDKIGASGMDSFGITMIYLELGEEFNCFDDDYYENVNYGFHTIDELADEVISHAN